VRRAGQAGTPFSGAFIGVKKMNQRIFKTGSWGKFAMHLALCACWPAWGHTTVTPYPKMAPVDQYLMERNAEIALARSAAPDSLSREADVFVLGPHGYEMAVKGKNAFVCVVERSWAAGPEDPDFWNPKLRAPVCFNAPAARSYLPIIFKKTEWILAGMSKERMFARTQSSLDNKELPALEPGSMCYMMSRDAYLGDAAGRWHPHLMFFVQQTSDTAWGAGLPGSPILAAQDTSSHLTVFMIPVGSWSDGTAEHSDDNSGSNSHKH
jgi:hypothetical protein